MVLVVFDVRGEESALAALLATGFDVTFLCAMHSFYQVRFAAATSHGHFPI